MAVPRGGFNKKAFSESRDHRRRGLPAAHFESGSFSVRKCPLGVAERSRLLPF